jgi:hypothetical protein
MKKNTYLLEITIMFLVLGLLELRASRKKWLPILMPQIICTYHSILMYHIGPPEPMRTSPFLGTVFTLFQSVHSDAFSTILVSLE